MVKKRMVANFESMLRVKLYFFFRNSLWKYLICTLVVGFLMPINSLTGTSSTIIYFVGLMLIVIPLIIISAKIQGNKIDIDVDIEFSEKEIILTHRNKELVEIKKWSWIKRIDIRKNMIYLVVDSKWPFAISFPKSELSTSEINFFERRKRTISLI